MRIRNRLDVPSSLLLALVCISFSQACNSKVKPSETLSEDSKQAVPLVCASAPRAADDLKNLNYGRSCSEITADHPEVLTDKPVENKKVLCPFLRMVERTGVWKEEVKRNLAEAANSSSLLPLRIKTLVAKALDFGCGETGCKPVAIGVSAGQQMLPPQKITDDSIVDIGRLSEARGTAHDCGYTFALGDTELNPMRRDMSLAMLKDRAKNGVELGLNDLIEVKKALCKIDYEEAKKTSLSRLKNKIDEANQTLIFSAADTVEFLLIYSFLGGVDRGSIRYQDVDDFLHARLPVFKTKYLLDGAMQAHLLSILAPK